MKGKAQLKKLVEYSNKIGYQVEFKRNARTEVDFVTKVITISTKLKEQNQIYSLLHELGHVLIRKSDAVFEKKYLYHKLPGRSKAYLVTEIEEEIHAWREGRQIAKSVGIKLNSDEYEKYSAELAMSYITYAVDKFSWKE